MEEKNYVILRTYKNVWKFEREIYSIEGIKLLLPVKPNEVLYFLVSVMITILIVKIVPFIDRVHFVLKYGFLPYGIMKLLTKQRLDGKLPHKFFLDYIIFKFSPGQLEHFKTVTIPKKKLCFSTPTVVKFTGFFNRTEEIISKSKREKNQNKNKIKFSKRRVGNV